MAESLKKKLLIIAPQNPFPPRDGGKIGIYYPIIYLTKYFQVHFAFITSEPVHTSVFDHFKEKGVAVYPYFVETRDRISGYVLNFSETLPYKFRKYCSPKVLANLMVIIKKENIDHVWCNHAHIAWYGLELNNKLGVRIYLREHNIEYSLVRQAMKSQPNRLIRSFIYYQLRKTKSFEVNCWRKFNRTFFISDSDFKQAKEVLGELPSLRLLYDSFPHASDISTPLKEAFSFIFTGSVESFQNKYNIRKFINDIWLPLVEKDSRWKLYITGNKDGVAEKILETDFKANNIISLGFVEDIEAAIASKKYFISPTYIGSGIRIKVLNALSGGAVCFVTPLDLSMLNIFKDDHNIVKFFDFYEFYAKLFKLENDEQLYNSISLRAKQVSTYFTWTNYAEKVNNEIG